MFLNFRLCWMKICPRDSVFMCADDIRRVLILLIVARQLDN